MTDSIGPPQPRARSQRVINKTEKVLQYEEMRQQQQQHHHQHGHGHGHGHKSSHNPQGQYEQEQLAQLHLAAQQQQQPVGGSQMSQQQQSFLEIGESYPGLNEINDAFEAFPQELVRYFTLLKEIDAKCVYTGPMLTAYIARFLSMSVTHPKRQVLLFKIKNLIKELMPSLEEKMHVASIAIDCVVKNVNRIEEAYNEIINNNEIPENIRIGPLNHPAMIMDDKDSATTTAANAKSAQSQRSESRREALAAKRLNNGNNNNESQDDEDSGHVTPAVASNTSTTTGSSRRNKKAQAAAAAQQQQQTTSTATTTSSRKRRQDETVTPRPNTPTSAATIVATKNAASLPSVQQVKKKQAQAQAAAAAAAAAQTSSLAAAAGQAPVGGVNPTIAGTTTSFGQSITQAQAQAQAPQIKQQQPDIKKPTVQVIAATTATTGGGGGTGAGNTNNDDDNYQEPVYCYCQQVSFGEMVGCDGDDCKKEWFHLPCIGLNDPPKGKWYCNDCQSKLKKSRR